MALERRGRPRLLIANLSQRRQTVRVDGIKSGAATVYRLNRGNVAAAAIDPDAFVQRAGEAVNMEPGVSMKMAPHEVIAVDQ